MNPEEHAAYAPATPAPLVDGSRRLAVASLLALIVLCLAWELFLAPLRPGGSWLALKALLCLVLFTACTAHIRLRLRDAPTPAPAAPH